MRLRRNRRPVSEILPSVPSRKGPAERRGTIHPGACRGNPPGRSGAKRREPRGPRRPAYAKAAISATADWRLTVAGAASGAS
jgi:hypothetical protein